MVILGLETTCDETGAAIIENGSKILSNVVSSSISFHRKYSGVVPEIAAREQVKVIIPIIREALEVSGVRYQDIDAIAVAHGPGLVGSLLIGVETAKTLAFVWRKPLIPVNHLIGHVYANWLQAKSKVKSQKSKLPEFPLVALIVSGGHTDLILTTNHGKYKWLGGTRDDAAGEAFDKVARVLGLGYPGGPEVEQVARNFKFQISNFKFPRPMINSGDFDFSFSGLKTAVVTRVNASKNQSIKEKAEIAFEFQQAVCDVLVTKTLKAANRFEAKSIVVGGGVAANEELRSKCKVQSAKLGIPVFFPLKQLSVDNGSMIAAAAYFNFRKMSPGKVKAEPGLYL